MNGRASEDRRRPNWEVERKRETAAGETVRQDVRDWKGRNSGSRAGLIHWRPKAGGARRKPGLATRIE